LCYDPSHGRRPLEIQFVKFTEHFTINKIDVYGNTSEELKEFVIPFRLPF